MERIGQRELYARGGITKWYWDFRDRAVLEYTKDATSVLDIGCGEGITLQRVWEQNCKRTVFGIDPEPGNIKACGALPAKRGDAYNVPGSGWDCCLLLDVIEHLADPYKALSNIHDALAVDGRLVLVFPNDRLFFWARLACLKFKAAFMDYGHNRAFNPTDTGFALKLLGFHIEVVRRIPVSFFPLHYLIVARKI